MVAIGLGAAAVGFLIGRLFHTAGVSPALMPMRRDFRLWTPELRRGSVI